MAKTDQWKQQTVDRTVRYSQSVLFRLSGRRRDYGSSNVAIQRATKDIIQSMSTVGARPPPRGVVGKKTLRPRLDGALERHLYTSIEMFAADGAADEQLAGRELQRPGPGRAALLPNLRVVLRDKAHASRRHPPRFRMSLPTVPPSLLALLFATFAVALSFISS